MRRPDKAAKVCVLISSRANVMGHTVFSVSRDNVAVTWQFSVQ
jgi:hypothetical protein